MQKKTIISFLQNLGIVIFFFLLMAGSVAGVPSWPKEETPVGNFIISTNPYGIAIYQRDKHASLQFNGFGSFFVSKQLITIESQEINAQNIAYSRDDVIFDLSGNLYTEPPQNELDYIQKILGITLTKIENAERVAPLSSSLIYILNPRISGIFELQFPQNTIVSIDRETKQIILENPVGSIPVRVRDSLEEVRKLEEYL
jgi:hypothetical protein